MRFWIAQFFGLCGLGFMVYGLFSKNKDRMLRCVILNGLSFSIEYLLLSAYSGMGSNLFGVVRTYICLKKESDPRLNQKMVLLAIMMVYLVIGIFSFDGWISILPILAEEIYVVSLWQTRVQSIRLGTAAMVILWLIYDLVVAAYPSAVCDLIVLISSILSIFVKKNINDEP